MKFSFKCLIASLKRSSGRSWMRYLTNLSDVFDSFASNSSQTFGYGTLSNGRTHKGLQFLFDAIFRRNEMLDSRSATESHLSLFASFYSRTFLDVPNTVLSWVSTVCMFFVDNEILSRKLTLLYLFCCAQMITTLFNFINIDKPNQTGSKFSKVIKAELYI